MDNQVKQSTNKLSKWAFGLFIATIISIIVTAIYILQFTGGQDIVLYFKLNGINGPGYDAFVSNMTILSILFFLFLIAGIVFTLLSLLKKEVKNYQFYISSIGFSAILLLGIISLSTNP